MPAHDAFYMGLALAVTPTGPQLYAADFKNNRVEVYNAQWALVNSDKFVDPTLPAGYGAYGIQTVGNRIFVTYAQQGAPNGREIPGAGRGYVSAFDFAGNFLARVASGGVLNAPWGTALAHPNFGAYGGDLLIGNFGDGRINAFHENADGTWTPSGTLRGLNGQPLFIGGLWAIQFGQRRRQQRRAQPPVLHRRPERRVRGPVRPDHPEPVRGGRHGAGDAVADAGHPGVVRRVHPGRGEGLPRVHDGERDLQRR